MGCGLVMANFDPFLLYPFVVDLLLEVTINTHVLLGSIGSDSGCYAIGYFNTGAGKGAKASVRVNKNNTM